MPSGVQLGQQGPERLRTAACQSIFVDVFPTRSDVFFEQLRFQHPFQSFNSHMVDGIDN